MTTEQYLEQVYEAEKEKADLMREIDKLQPKYDQACQPARHVNYDIVVQKSRVNKSQTEIAALKLYELGEDIDTLKRSIAGCRARINEVKKTVDKAGLTCDEKEYITLRYFKRYSRERIEREMHRTHTHRLKNSALEKIEIELKKTEA